MCMTYSTINELLDLIRRTVNTVYPMGLPPHDVISTELENTENLSGTQVCER